VVPYGAATANCDVGAAVPRVREISIKGDYPSHNGLSSCFTCTTGIALNFKPHPS
jgi:hypothetical protein